MLTRVLTGIIAFIVFLPFLVHSDTVAFPIAMSVCSVISVYELLRCVGMHKRHYVTLPVVAVAAALPICVRYLTVYEAFAIGLAAALVLMLYMLAITVFSHGEVDITQSSTALMISLYIVAAFSCMVYLCDYCGEYIYLLAFVGAWVPDTFAYFTGCLFGKHKLIPDVSPKKTVEGAIGGIVFCTIAFVVFALVYNRLLLSDPTQVNAMPVESFRALPVWLMAIVGVLSAVVSMIGDLSMSVIKRHYGVKDYGKILPGHGGFLDRFDSVLAVAVILAVALGIATNVGLM